MHGSQAIHGDYVSVDARKVKDSVRHQRISNQVSNPMTLTPLIHIN